MDMSHRYVMESLLNKESPEVRKEVLKFVEKYLDLGRIINVNHVPSEILITKIIEIREKLENIKISK
jgi:hypothetical protein